MLGVCKGKLADIGLISTIIIIIIIQYIYYYSRWLRWYPDGTPMVPRWYPDGGVLYHPRWRYPIISIIPNKALTLPLIIIPHYQLLVR